MKLIAIQTDPDKLDAEHIINPAQISRVFIPSDARHKLRIDSYGQAFTYEFKKWAQANEAYQQVIRAMKSVK